MHPTKRVSDTMVSRWRIWHFMVIVAGLAVALTLVRTEAGAGVVFFLACGGTEFLVIMFGARCVERIGNRVTESLDRGGIGDFIGHLVGLLVLCLTFGAMMLVALAWVFVYVLFLIYILGQPLLGPWP